MPRTPIWKERAPREYIPYLVLLVIALCAMALCLLFLPEGVGADAPHTHAYTETIVPATCYTDGYTRHTCAGCGDAYDDHVVPAAHSFGAMQVVTEAGVNQTGTARAVCTVCGAYQEQTLPPTISFPAIYLEGDSLQQVSGEQTGVYRLRYEAYNVSFTTTAVLKVQGFTSAGFPKKNYNIKFYQDSSCRAHDKQDLGYGDWGAQWRYTLKANWIDASHARNIVSCRIFGQMAQTRAVKNEDLLAAPNAGCTDGFPVCVYVNGDYYGLYTMNISKTKWMFGINEEDYPHSAIITAQMHDATNKFRASADLYDTNERTRSWDVEYCSTGTDIAWLNTSFNDLIDFVRYSDWKTFRRNAYTYIDVDAVIDLAIMCWTMYGPDNVDKNIVYVTYNGVQWVPCLYDADCSFGLHWNGQSFYSREEMAKMLPVQTPTYDSNTSLGNNLLFTRTLYCFFNEFQQRYWELRESTLSNESLVGAFRTFFDSLPADAYVQDRRRWTMPDPVDAESGYQNELGQIQSFVSWRMALLDKAVQKMHRDN